MSRDIAVPPDRRLRRWPEVARQYAQSLGDLLDRGLDVGLIRRRWDLMTTIDAVHPLS